MAPGVQALRVQLWGKEMLVRKYMPDNARILDWWTDELHVGKYTRLERAIESITFMAGRECVGRAVDRARSRRQNWRVDAAAVETAADDVFPASLLNGAAEKYNCVSCLSDVFMEAVGRPGFAEVFFTQMRDVLADGGVFMAMVYDTALLHRQACVESATNEHKSGILKFSLADVDVHAQPAVRDHHRLLTLEVMSEEKPRAQGLPVRNITEVLRVAEAHGFEVVECTNLVELLYCYHDKPPWHQLLVDYNALDRQGKIHQYERSLVQLYTTLVLRRRRLPREVWDNADATAAAAAVAAAARGARAPPSPSGSEAGAGNHVVALSSNGGEDLSPEQSDRPSEADSDMNVDIPWEGRAPQRAAPRHAMGDPDGDAGDADVAWELLRIAEATGRGRMFNEQMAAREVLKEHMTRGVAAVAAAAACPLRSCALNAPQQRPSPPVVQQPTHTSPRGIWHTPRGEPAREDDCTDSNRSGVASSAYHTAITDVVATSPCLSSIPARRVRELQTADYLARLAADLLVRRAAGCGLDSLHPISHLVATTASAKRGLCGTRAQREFCAEVAALIAEGAGAEGL